MGKWVVMSLAADAKCLRCQSDMMEVGEISLMTGKHSGAAKLFFGSLAEADERPWPVQVYTCTSCRWVELHDLGA